MFQKVFGRAVELLQEELGGALFEGPELAHGGGVEHFAEELAVFAVLLAAGVQCYSAAPADSGKWLRIENGTRRGRGERRTGRSP